MTKITISGLTTENGKAVFRVQEIDIPDFRDVTAKKLESERHLRALKAEQEQKESYRIRRKRFS
jgi:hypothetical protein